MNPERVRDHPRSCRQPGPPAVAADHDPADEQPGCAELDDVREIEAEQLDPVPAEPEQHDVGDERRTENPEDGRHGGARP
jgi:hypothetical protein